MMMHGKLLPGIRSDGVPSLNIHRVSTNWVNFKIPMGNGVNPLGEGSITGYFNSSLMGLHK